MERQDKINKIQAIKKEDEVHEILMDLLPNMGYLDVTLTHERGSLPENGKDIVASKNDTEENKKEWYAYVVKQGDIRGTSKGVQEIKAQILDCFNYSWNSIFKGKNIKINKVKVAINGKFTSGAISKILEDNALHNPNISFWSSIELVEHIDKYYPRFWLKGSKTYKHYIEVFQGTNREDDLVKAIGLKNEKLKKIIDFAIKPKLVEISVSDEGDIKRKWFDSTSIIKLNECSLIVGEPGSGKSTFFKQLSNDIIYQNSLRNEYELYPFIIKFGDFESNEFDVEKVIEHHITKEEFCKIGLDIEEILKNKNYVLFIDALDEIGSEELKQKALVAIQIFIKDHPNIKIYCSSRPADSLLGDCQKLKFKYLEISNVTQKQAEYFLNRYFVGEQVKCQRLLRSLKDSHILEKLPQTPLTLALIAAIFDESEIEIPATISDLYKHFVDLLLNKSLKDSTLDLLKIGIHRSTLSYLAEHLHTNRVTFILRDELIELLKKFAEERGHKYNVAELLHDLVENVGLLIETRNQEISFKHLSFQEYFTAYQFYNHNINGKNLFIENFNDIWWQNVAIYYAGMTKDSPDLIKEILEKSKPTNFREYVSNLTGIGFLMQALYNTPISSRIEGIKRNISNIDDSATFLLTTKDPTFDLLKLMLNTRFGVFRFFSYWFELHHNSITLKEPMENYLNEIVKNIETLEINSKDRMGQEYAAYLLASTLGEIDGNYKRLEKLLDAASPDNHGLRALISSNFDDHYTQFSKEEKARKEIKKFKSKLDLLDADRINKKINIRLSDGKMVFTKSKKSGRQKHTQPKKPL